MKIFVSTLSTQGALPGDFSFVPEGELVGRYSFVCDLEKPDGSGCGCGRAFGGFVTHSGTTTAVVVDTEITELEWRARLFQTLCDAGWASAMDATDLAEVVDDLVQHDLAAAGQLPVGTVVGRRAWNSHGATVDNLTYRGLAVSSVQHAE